MSGVRTLAYLGITSPTLDEWRQVGDLLGTQVVDRDGEVDLRLDRREWRVRISSGEADDLAYAGWEVADDRELDAVVEQLRTLGHKFEDTATGEAEARQVRRLVRGTDPDGNQTEIFHSAAVSGDRFVSPHGSEFATDLGVGHMVLYCSDLAAMLDFYCDGLGLRVTDAIDLGSEFIYFLRINERHHSLALVAGKDQFTLQHLMFEVTDIDQVGAAFERCAYVDLAQTDLGRHSNDEMFSFYAMAPGGYTIEYGWGGRLVDESVHRGASYTTTSWWGHRDLRPSRG
jgi:2,3-dihydroxybiphenyl 1,2-dioxygenase